MALSHKEIENFEGGEKPYKRADGGGLYVLVTADGARYWRLDYRLNGKRKTLALGTFPAVSLKEARDKRDDAKKLIAAGKDPIQVKRAEKVAAQLSAANTFEAVAREWHENQKPGWTETYAGQIITRLEADLFPDLGSRPIAEIEPYELLHVLRKVEKRGALDIAKRLRQTASQIFRYAVLTLRAKHDPAADLKGALKTSGRQEHHKALPREALPQFLRALDSYDGAPQTRLALRLMVLTFVRTTELRAAEWSEINFEAAEWRIPAARMKMREEHIVPLSRQAVAVLKVLQTMAGKSRHVFPSPARDGYMSNNTMLYAMYRMGFHGRATVHGFRAVASTALNEMGFNPDWIERQLAHGERNKVRAAYNHAQYLPERRHMMQQWADFVDEIASNGKVVPFAAKVAS